MIMMMGCAQFADSAKFEILVNVYMYMYLVFFGSILTVFFATSTVLIPFGCNFLAQLYAMHKLRL